MTGALLRGQLDVDPCGLAILLSVVTGLAAIADPALDGLTFALVALGLGAFLIGLRPRHAGRIVVDGRTLVALSLLALGAVAFFGLPPALEPVRAVALAFSATPVWWVHRSTALPRRGSA